MFQRLLVPLDGSPGAEQAIPVAASLARSTHGSLVFLHIVAPATAFKSMVAPVPETSELVRSTSHTAPSVSSHERQREAARTSAIEQVMADAASYLPLLPTRYADDLAGLSTEMDIAFGTASPTLPSTALLEHVDLIVLCRHQEMGMGQWGLESIAQQVMRHSPVPLLILNEQKKAAMPVLDGTHPLRVLVPLDGSLFAETALEPVLHLLSYSAGPGQHELCLLHVVDLFAGDGTGEEEAHMSPYTTKQAHQSAERYLQAVANRLQKRDDCGRHVQITCLVTSSVDIASAILTQTEQETTGSEPAAFSLIALATHGREGIQRQISGSIAERLFNTTTVPLFTVCPRKTMVRLLNFALPAGGRN
jgi:nucleotide-binding universal stress UspA family protein